MWTDEDLRAGFHRQGGPPDPRRVDALMWAIRRRPRMRWAAKSAAAAVVLVPALGASLPASRAEAAYVAQLIQHDVFHGPIGGMRVTVAQNRGTRPVVGPRRSTGGSGAIAPAQQLTIGSARRLAPVWMGTPTLDPSRLSHAVALNISTAGLPGVETEGVVFTYALPGVEPVSVQEETTMHRLHSRWVLGGGHYVGLSQVSISGAQMDTRVRSFTVSGTKVLWVLNGGGRQPGSGTRQSMMAFKDGPVQVIIQGAAASDSFMRRLVSNLLSILPK